MGRRIFISYSHQDANLADQVGAALQRANLLPFLDRVHLNPGDSLTARIGAALTEANSLVVLISKHSVSSRWVQDELRTIRDLGTPVIPVMCDDVSMPAPLKLVLGDPLHLGAGDLVGAVGVIPKLFPEMFRTAA